MSQHVVVLVIETDTEDGNPADWDWQNVIDSPNPVTVVVSGEVVDYPSDKQVGQMHELAKNFIDSVYEAGLGVASL